MKEMTPEEAIEILDNEYKRIELQIMSLKGTIKENTESFRYRIDVKESLKTAITALEEIQQYRAIGTVEEFRGAMEKQKPNKPHRNYKKFSGLWCKCGWYLGQKQCLDIKYCPNCGQAIAENLEGMEYENT